MRERMPDARMVQTYRQTTLMLLDAMLAVNSLVYGNTPELKDEREQHAREWVQRATESVFL